MEDFSHNPFTFVYRISTPIESDSETEEYSGRDELHEELDEEDGQATMTNEDKKQFKRFGDIKLSKFFSNFSRITGGLKHAFFDSPLKESL